MEEQFLRRVALRAFVFAAGERFSRSDSLAGLEVGGRDLDDALGTLGVDPREVSGSQHLLTLGVVREQVQVLLSDWDMEGVELEG